MRKAFKYRAYATQTTARNARRCIWVCKTIYNIALSQRIYHYKYHNETLSAYDQHKVIKRKGGLDGLEWLGLESVNIHALQDVLGRLHKAYQHFFRRIKQGSDRPGFPRFAGRKYNSFTLRIINGKPSGWKIIGTILVVKHIGAFRLRLHRPIEGQIKTVTVKQLNDKWYISFSCDDVTPAPHRPTGKTVSICLARPWFGGDSDGNIINELRFYREALNGLAFRQRRVSRKVKGSNRRRRAVLLLAKYHEKIANRRKHIINNLVAMYTDNYDKIVINRFVISSSDTRLDKKEVAKKYYTPEHNQSVLDQSWGMFVEGLVKKAEEKGVTIKLVEKFEYDYSKSLFENINNLKACAEPAPLSTTD